MNQVYDWQPGDSVYSELMHRLGLEVAECIKTRMEVVHEQIVTAMGTRRRTATRIISLGSGPAREIELALAGARNTDGQVEFTLIDQETEALRYACEKTYPSICACKGARACNA